MATNTTAIANALPELIQAERVLSQLAADRGIEYRIAPFGGLRTESDTTRILKYRDDDYAVYARAELAAGRVPLSKEKWRPIAPFGSSYHNYGGAFDIQITKAAQGKTNAQSLEIVGHLAPQAGLRWGITFNDPPHFELPYSLATVKLKWEQYKRGNGVTGIPRPGASAIPVVGAIAVLGLLLLGVRRWLM